MGLAMFKIMALDIGTKRIGVALSDFLHILATPVECVPRVPEVDAVKRIIKLAKDNHVKTIVAGVPINMDGTKGAQAEDCENFAKYFSEFDIIFEDERLTSEEAEERLRSRKVNFRKNKGLVDMESASIILEQYLSRKK